MVRLHRLFNYQTEKINPAEALVMVLENEGRKFCVLVDEVLGQQQAVIKALDKNFKKVDGVAGATILGDGNISLILDIHGMERMAFSH
jgi:two-component system chemotaxis sensor kinase CheA